MIGMDASTGRPLAGLDHLYQSVRDILTTPIGSRVLRRAYGSRLPRLLDRPINQETVVEITMATAEALRRWEPRYRITRVQLGGGSAGLATMDLQGVYRPEGKPLSLLFKGSDLR